MTYPNSDRSPEVQPDELFTVLSHPYRRRLLVALLADTPGGSDEFEADTVVTDGDDPEAVWIQLYHSHLPKLDAAGFIDWDRETVTFTRGPRFDMIAPLLKLLADHEDELPGDWPGPVEADVSDPVRTPRGQPATDGDISNAVAQQRAETLLDGSARGHDTQFQLLVESIEDYAIFMLDSAGHVISWNPGARRIKGYREEEILGEHFSVFYPDEDVEQGVPIENLTAAEAEGRIQDEGWRVHEDGSRFYAHVTISAITNDDGYLRGFAKVTRDMTTERRYQELERRKERLEEFANVMAHDLRNPLQVAQAHLELLETDTDEAERRETIEEALGRMDAIIDDLLTLARHGETVNSIGTVHLAAVAEDAWSTSNDPNTGGDADLAIETGLAFDADQGRLRELLENLLANAIEHGGEDITVEIGDLPDDTGFYVEDDGPGIQPDEREQVFEAGYSTTDDGTGFGLSIVKRIADAHGWHTSVTEGDGGGARFEISGVEPVS